MFIDQVKEFFGFEKIDETNAEFAIVELGTNEVLEYCKNVKSAQKAQKSWNYLWLYSNGKRTAIERIR